MESKIIARGRPASPGKMTGVVRVVTKLDELSKVVPGCILVVKNSNPAWSIGMMKASGLISEVGGIISHAAIVAREMGIPCIVAVENATTILKDDQIVEINGTEGIIYEWS